MTSPDAAPDPFAALGLPVTPMLTDEQVRAAWRAIAAGTHPDRDDGGDPDAYRKASAAYAVLRSPWGRTEAYADLTPHHVPDLAPAEPPAVRDPAEDTGVLLPASERPTVRPAIAAVPARVRYGRPARLAIRVACAAVIVAAAWLAGAGPPAAAGVTAAVVTWLALTGRGDLAPPPGR